MNTTTLPITETEQAIINAEELKIRRVLDREMDINWAEIRLPVKGSGQLDHLTVDLWDHNENKSPRWTVSLCGLDRFDDPESARALAIQLERAANLCDRLNGVSA